MSKAYLMSEGQEYSVNAHRIGECIELVDNQKLSLGVWRVMFYADVNLQDMTKLLGGHNYELRPYIETEESSDQE